MEKTFRIAFATIAALAAGTSAGCSIIVDDAIEDRDAGGMDATVTSCEGATDGTACGTGRVCVDGVCALSACGDRVVDPGRGEECDDGNGTPDDGCEPNTCAFSCESDADCDDLEECNGTATCSSAHVCQAGTNLENGTDCMLVGVTAPDAGTPDPDAGVGDGGVDDPTRGQCREGVCVIRGCGNGVRGGTEECDDGNTTEGDGCDNDCTYTCETDEECQNETVCDGTETCDVANHVCEPGEAPDCADTANVMNGRGSWGPDCTVDTCDPLMGCVNTLRDTDSDGFPPASYTIDGTTYDCQGTAANDCNDIDANVYPGAEEICDGRDNNCAGGTDETAPTWFSDCDGDTFAALGAMMFTGCTPPASTGCPDANVARWTTTRPIAGNRTTYDCNDANGAVRPTQDMYGLAIPPPGGGYDWNCDNTYQQEVPDPPPCPNPPCLIRITCLSGRCFGDWGWADGSAPACGAAESFDYCVETGGSTCGTSTRSRTQRCR